MANVQWKIRGQSFSNCNCAWGCPCQFNALPTHGNCRANVFIEIEDGHFGDISLDGCRVGFLGTWPGPIHEGHGTAMVVVDERSTPEQRNALEAIASGRETEPGGSMFNIFVSMCDTLLPTICKPIDFKMDIEKRTASLHVPGLVDGSAEPIKNPMTGQEHRARVTLPSGFEYTEAEYASGSTRATGPITLDFQGTHAHLNHFHWSRTGVVR